MKSPTSAVVELGFAARQAERGEPNSQCGTEIYTGRIPTNGLRHWDRQTPGEDPEAQLRDLRTGKGSLGAASGQANAGGDPGTRASGLADLGGVRGRGLGTGERGEGVRGRSPPGGVWGLRPHKTRRNETRPTPSVGMGLASSGAAGNRTRVLRRFSRASPCAVRCVSAWISESREQAQMTIPVAVRCPIRTRDRLGR